MIRYLLSTFCCLLFIFFAYGQTPKIGFERISLEKIQSQVHILSIFKDSKGFLWFGTYNGVYRYDGTTYVKYCNNFDDSTSISHNAVTCIFEDRDHTLWFGTEVGLNRFNRKTERFERFLHEASNPNSISASGVKSILQDKNGLLWIATFGGGLNSYDIKNKKFRAYLKNKTASSISYQRINHIYIDRSNTLWLGGENCGMAIFDPRSETFTEVKLLANKQSKDITVNSIYEDRQGTIWVGTWGDGLIRLDGAKAPLQYLHDAKNANSLSVNIVRTITEDRLGQVWLGTYLGGIDIFNKQNSQFTNLRNQAFKEESISNDIVWQLFTDRSGIIWVGTFGGGINKYDPYSAKFPLFRYEQNSNNCLNNNQVSSVCEMHDGLVCLGTMGGGVNIFDPQTKRFTHPKTTASNLQMNIRYILEDSHQKMWVATEDGFYRTDSKFSVVDDLPSKGSSPFSLQNKSIYRMLEDLDGNIWFCTWGNGLFMIPKSETSKARLSDMEPISFMHPKAGQLGLPVEVVPSLLQDSKGRIWIGTLNGLYLYDKGNRRFVYYPNNPKAKKMEQNYAVSALFEDKDRTLWIGTFGQGISRFDPSQPNFNYISEREGLASGTISGITQDRQGNLWVSTIKGLSKINPENLKVKTFDKLDGLQDNTFSLYALACLKNGLLIFGGPKGFNLFNPMSIIDNPYSPPIAFTDLKLFNKTVTVGDETNILSQRLDETEKIKLNYTQYAFSISFTNLSYSLLDKCRYAYKLVGFDKDWIYTDADNATASYSNLRGGDYTFLLKACNSDGNWTTEPRVLKIKVSPPFWKSFWFVLLISFLAASVATYLFGLKLKRVSRMKDIEMKMQEAKFEEQKMKSEREIVNLQKEKLDQELEHKNKELASYVMGMIQKNEKMGSIRDSISELLPISNSEVHKRLTKLIKNIEEEIGDDSNWDKFSLSFNMIHDNFLKRFAEEYSTMTHNDLRICAYIRMNLSNKEIANLLNVSVRTIESTRYRVRKKLELESDTNLNDYILRY